MSKLNWERVTLENRIASSGSASVRDWGEEETKTKGGKRKLAEGWTRCSICKVVLRSENLSRHDKKIHGIRDRQQLMDAGILPTTKCKLKYGPWPHTRGNSLVDRFAVDIVDDDPAWERQRVAATQISSIAPRIMLRHKGRSFVRQPIRCTLICYLDDSEARQIARDIVQELASLVSLTVRVEAKKPRNCGDFVVHL